MRRPYRSGSHCWWTARVERMKRARLAVLVSGSGTVLEAILGAGLDVSLVAADRACRALEVAEVAGVPAQLVLRETFDKRFDRSAYTRRLVDVLQAHEIDVVAMAGFGTVLAPQIFADFPGRILNTHPALLPNFKGWHAVRDALTAGVEVTGTTVHLATEDVDAGPVLAQAQVPVLPGDTEATLHERIKAVERTLYPEAIRRFMAELQTRSTR